MSLLKYLFLLLLLAGWTVQAVAQSPIAPPDPQGAPAPSQLTPEPQVDQLIAPPMKERTRSVASATSTSLPLNISYQGLLTTGLGTPVADGSYDLTISFYDSLTAGTVQWSEIHAGVPVQRGTFNVSLGVSTPLSLAFDKPMFVQVAATNGPAGPSYPLTFSPRSELTSAPYSLAPWVTNGTDIYYKHGNIGIGSSAPESSGIGTLKIDIADEDGNNSDMALRVAGGATGTGTGYPLIHFAKSKGTLAAPLAATYGNYMGQLDFDGYDGSAYRGAATILGWIDSTPAPLSIPGALSFYTWNKTRGWNEKMRLDHNGGLSIDGGYMNNGTLSPGLVFGGYGTGEGIASKRTTGGNQWGLDFYTAYNPRMSINNYGWVGIGTTAPSNRLTVKDSSYGYAGYVYNVNVGSAYGLQVQATNSAAIPGSYRTGLSSYTYYGRVYNDAGYFYAYGVDTSVNYGAICYGFGGTTAYGVYASGGSYAGYFAGNLAYTGSLIFASDEKFKEGIKDYSGALERIMQVRPRTYSYKSGKEFDRFNFSPGTHYGFVAQELEQVFPELVTTVVQPEDRDENGTLKNQPEAYKGIKTMEMIPILLQAIQEQQKRIDDLQAKVDRLENK